MTIRIVTRTSPNRSKDAFDQTLPERFAWRDEEALVIFGNGVRPAAWDETARGQGNSPHILIAGRPDPRIGDVRSALEVAYAYQIDRFVIVERSSRHFMQCLCQGDQWLLEKQEGSEAAHYRAMLSPGKSAAMANEQEPEPGTLTSRMFSKQPVPAYYLNFALTCEAMQRYFKGEPEPDWLQWERIELL